MKKQELEELRRLKAEAVAHLPEDISVLEAWEAPDSFHPRYDAKGKEYVYRIRNSRVKDPFTAATTCLWQIHGRNCWIINS